MLHAVLDPFHYNSQPAPIGTQASSHGHGPPTSLSGKKSKTTRNAPVIEICSPGSGGGKSQLAYYLIAMSVLPATFNGAKLDGQNGAVVLVDNDGRLDARRLSVVMRGIIQRGLRGSAANTTLSAEEYHAEDTQSRDLDTDIQSLINNSLQHIHVFRPQTSSSLLSTLRSLDTYLLSRHLQPTSSTAATTTTTGSRPLHAIFLDSASAFYWTDRLRDEIRQTQEIGLSGTEIQQRRDSHASFHMSILYADIAAELRRLRIIFDCAIVYTTWGITPRLSFLSSTTSPSSAAGEVGVAGGGHSHIWSGPPTFKPHLPAPWNSTFPDLRLVVQRDYVRTYPSTASPEEWKQDAPIRQEVVRRGKFSAWVDTNSFINNAWSSGDDRGEAILKALGKMPDNGGFPFWVRDDGVFMDDLTGDID